MTQFGPSRSRPRFTDKVSSPALSNKPKTLSVKQPHGWLMFTITKSVIVKRCSSGRLATLSHTSLSVFGPHQSIKQPSEGPVSVKRCYLLPMPYIVGVILLVADWRGWRLEKDVLLQPSYIGGRLASSILFVAPHSVPGRGPEDAPRRGTPPFVQMEQDVVDVPIAKFMDQLRDCKVLCPFLRTLLALTMLPRI